MEISESPIADWSKEEEYNNWFDKFNDIDIDDGFAENEADENQNEGGEEE